ncbi:hypothetical protein ILYODFUR_029480 [Ilyodon furcidens]|uniref:Uncharacterized protein n=1 Tax=Ilyodon furcidens TaxID=33524 RepID=A0ABV0TC41_9TELE
MHVVTVERKNSLLTGRNLQQNQAQCERPSATTDWGFDRTEQRHKKNKEAVIQEYFLWERKVNVNGCSSNQQPTFPFLTYLFIPRFLQCFESMSRSLLFYFSYGNVLCWLRRNMR